MLLVDARCRECKRISCTYDDPTHDVTLCQYQANSWPVGVDFEEAGEKWRAGDAAKSLRFFSRAIDAYDAGLRKFPQSFDLSYNK